MLLYIGLHKAQNSQVQASQREDVTFRQILMNLQLLHSSAHSYWSLTMPAQSVALPSLVAPMIVTARVFYVYLLA